MPVIATLTSEAVTTPPLRPRRVVLPRARDAVYPADDRADPVAAVQSPRRHSTDPSRSEGAPMTIETADHILAGATGSPLPQGVWSVDSRRSEIGFAVKEMWGLRTVRGVFGRCKGGLVVRPKGAMGEL